MFIYVVYILLNNFLDISIATNRDITDTFASLYNMNASNRTSFLSSGSKKKCDEEASDNFSTRELLLMKNVLDKCHDDDDDDDDERDVSTASKNVKRLAESDVSTTSKKVKKTRSIATGSDKGVDEISRLLIVAEKARNTSKSKKVKRKDSIATGSDEGLDEISRLLIAAEKARNMSESNLMSMKSYVRVADLPAPTVMEIKEIQPTKTKDKSDTIESYIVSFEDGRETITGSKEVRKTSIPACVIDYPFQLKSPAVVIYLGKSTDLDGERILNFRRAELQGDSLERESVLDMLRCMSRKQLTYFFDIRTIGEFRPGSVFVLDRIRILDDGGIENVGYPVVRYRTTIDGISVVGELFLPLRCRKEVTKIIPCIMIFRGETLVV